MAAPFVFRRRSSIDRKSEDALLKATLDGDLGGFKGNGDGAAVFSINKDDFGVLPCAAREGHLEVCKYLVEELGGDVNMPAAEGSCKVIEFLLSSGVPLDMDFGRGTPLYYAVTSEQDKIVKILLDHHTNAGADVNGKGSILSPLLIATQKGGYTDFIPFLLKAEGDPNISDDLGRLPIELAALNGCREEVEMLFPLTLPIPNVPNWSIDGVISHAKLNNAKPMIEGRKAMLKSEAGKAFRRKDYDTALAFYNSAIDLAPDARLYSNRSLCKAQMGDGEGALLDAYQCKMMRPGWAKTCYRQAAAPMVLEMRYVQEYKQAGEAILEAQELDPETEDIEVEIRKVNEAMTISPDEDEF